MKLYLIAIISAVLVVMGLPAMAKDHNENGKRDNQHYSQNRDHSNGKAHHQKQNHQKQHNQKQRHQKQQGNRHDYDHNRHQRMRAYNNYPRYRQHHGKKYQSYDRGHYSHSGQRRSHDQRAAYLVGGVLVGALLNQHYYCDHH